MSQDSPDWIKKKKPTINPKNTDDKCFQYAATVALKYGEVKWKLGKVSNIKQFINKYNWKGINYYTKIRKIEENVRKCTKIEGQ